MIRNTNTHKDDTRKLVIRSLVPLLFLVSLITEKNIFPKIKIDCVEQTVYVTQVITIKADVFWVIC